MCDMKTLNDMLMNSVSSLHSSRGTISEIFDYIHIFIYIQRVDLLIKILDMEQYENNNLGKYST